MRIALSAGHNVYNGEYFDCGCIGNGKRECDITKETVRLLISMLKKQGHTVIDVTPYNENFKTKKDHHILRCKKVDEFKADLYLDIHINAGGGTGVEVWTYSANSKSVPYAAKISNSISKNIGISNRGVKYESGYWSVSLCKAPAMIIEGAFIDSKPDMEKLTPLKYAESIAECFGKVEKESDIKEEKKLDKIKIDLHGKQLETDGIYQEGINYIPVRFLEQIGYDIDWKNGTVSIDYKEVK